MPATAKPSSRPTAAEAGLPDALALRAPSGAVAIVRDADGVRRVEGTLYSGGVVVYQGRRIVVDLETIRMSTPRQMMFDHTTRIGVWKSLDVRRDDAGLLSLVGAGPLFADEPEVERIARHADAEYPFEASIRVTNFSLELYEEGERVRVNGRTIAGPVLVQRHGRLRETSLCDVGVDPDTGATIFAVPTDEEPAVMEDTTVAEETTEETAAAEEKPAISLADATAEQLIESRPDLVEAIRNMAPPPGESAAEETTEMSHAATIAELKPLAPDDPGLVLMAIEKGFTKAQFEAVVELASRSKAAAEAAGETAVDGGAGTHAAAGDATQLSADPEEAWSQSERLRNRFKDNKSVFMRTALSCQRAGDDFRTLAKHN